MPESESLRCVAPRSVVEPGKSASEAIIAIRVPVKPLPLRNAKQFYIIASATTNQMKPRKCNFMQHVPLGLLSTLFSREQIQRARGVRKLHVVFGHPFDHTCIYMLDHQYIINFIYVDHDVRSALVILGVCQTCMAEKLPLCACTYVDQRSPLAGGAVLCIDLIQHTRKQLGPGWCG